MLDHRKRKRIREKHLLCFSDYAKAFDCVDHNKLWKILREMNYQTIALTSHANKVMLKILQARLRQYVNCELPDVQAGVRKGRGTKDQISNIHWIIIKAREFQKKHLFFPYWPCQSLCVDHNKLWKILKEMGIPDHLTFLLRNLYAGQEATVRTGHGTTDWFQIGKGVHQGCMLAPCLFNLYAEYIMRNTSLDFYHLSSVFMFSNFI